MADFREHTFAVYTIGVSTTRSPRLLDLADANGVDLFTLFSGALQLERGYAFEKNDVIKFERVDVDTTGRYITGLIQRGTHGENIALVKVNAIERTGTEMDTVINWDEAPASRYFFSMYVPDEGAVGYLMLQQRGNTSNYSFLNTKLQNLAYAHTLSLRLDRVAPPDYADRTRHNHLKKITFVKRGASALALLRMEHDGNLEEIGKVTITIEPKARTSMDSLWNLARMAIDGVSTKSTGILTADGASFEPDLVRYTAEINGKPVNVSSEVNVAGRPSFYEVFNLQDPERYIKMASFAKETFETIMGV